MPTQNEVLADRLRHLTTAPQTWTMSDCANLALVQDADFAPLLLNLIDAATLSIFLIQYQFRAPFRPSRLMQNILDDLVEAADRGVPIRILLNHPHHPSRLGPGHGKLYDALRHKLIHIRHAPTGRILHTKLAIIDERFTLMGSHNLSEASFKTSRNASALIDSPSFANRITRAYNRLWMDATNGTP